MPCDSYAIEAPGDLLFEPCAGNPHDLSTAWGRHLVGIVEMVVGLRQGMIAARTERRLCLEG